MKKIIGLGFILLAFPLGAFAETIVFKDGMRVEATRVREQNGEVQCEINGILFGYPKAEVKRIEKNGSGSRSAAALPRQVHKEEVTVVPKKQAAVAKKDKAAPKKEAAATESAGIPSFKVIINEDDRNPPFYIKLQRVLLVAPGLTKAQIRTLLLSYEKKLRDELIARKAKSKQIVIWAYDDFERANEGAAGWVGMISNKSATEKLSDAPELTMPEP